jgi:hypothetical protein
MAENWNCPTDLCGSIPYQILIICGMVYGIYMAEVELLDNV